MRTPLQSVEPRAVRGAVRGVLAGPLALALVLVLALVGCFKDEPYVTSSDGSMSAAATTIPATTTASTTLTTGEETTTTTTTTTSSTAEITGDPTTDPTTSTASSSTTEALPSTCPDDPALVLCYSFEGDISTVLIDASASNHPALATNVTAVAGKIGQGGQVTAASVIRVDDEGGPFGALLDTFTLAAWIAPEVAALPSRAGILSRATHFELSLVRIGGEVRVQCRRGGDTLGSGPVAFADWTHVACAYDGMILRIFVDGVEVTSADPGPADTVVPHDFFIGNLGPTPTPDDALVGRVDEVQVWSVALASLEICAAAGLLCD